MTSLKENAARIYGIRQMDDLLLWIAIDKTKKHTLNQAKRIKDRILRNNGLYLGGLELEEEKTQIDWIKGQKIYTHEFSGTRITLNASNPSVTCTTLNKNTISIEDKNEQTIVRYPPWESYTTEQSKRGVIIGTLHRIELQNTSIKLAAQSMYENYREYETLKYRSLFYCNTLKRIIRHKTIETEKIATIAFETIQLIKQNETIAHP